MEPRYAYHYALIDESTKMCIAVQTSTYDGTDDPNWVQIPVYDENYLFKYYINGSWYEDADGTIPWTSSLL